MDETDYIAAAIWVFIIQVNDRQGMVRTKRKNLNTDDILINDKHDVLASGYQRADALSVFVTIIIDANCSYITSENRLRRASLKYCHRQCTGVISREHHTRVCGLRLINARHSKFALSRTDFE